MKHVVIAPFEENANSILAGIREFPTEKVVLLTPLEHLTKAKNAQKEFDRFKIPVEIVEIESGNKFQENNNKGSAMETTALRRNEK
jgi:hypothetical protein